MYQYPGIGIKSILGKITKIIDKIIEVFGFKFIKFFI